MTGNQDSRRPLTTSDYEFGYMGGQNSPRILPQAPLTIELSGSGFMDGQNSDLSRPRTILLEYLTDGQKAYPIDEDCQSTDMDSIISGGSSGRKSSATSLDEEFPLPELDQSDTRTESSRDSSSIHSDLYAGIKYWGNPTILRCVFKKCGKNIGIDGWVPHLVDHIDDISELPYPIVWKCELGPSCSEDLPTPTTLECLFRHTLDHFIRARCDEDARKAYNSLLEILASNGANGVASSVGDNYLQCHGQETGYSVYHSVAHIVCGAGEQYSQHRDIDRSYITNRSEPRRSEAHQPESRSSVADLEAQPAEEPQSDTASNASSISLESRESQVYLSYGELQSRGERSRGEQKYYS